MRIAGLDPDLSIGIQCECHAKVNHSKSDQVIAIVRKDGLPICKLNRRDFEEPIDKKNVRIIKPETVAKINNVANQIKNEKFDINNSIENTWLELNKIDEKSLTDLLKRYPEIENDPYKRCGHVTKSDYENAVRQNQMLNDLKEKLMNHKEQHGEWSKQLLLKINSCIRSSLAIMNTYFPRMLKIHTNKVLIESDDLLPFSTQKDLIWVEGLPYGVLFLEKEVDKENIGESKEKIKEKLKCFSTSITQLVVTSENIDALTEKLKILFTEFVLDNQGKDILEHLSLVLAVNINNCKTLITISGGNGCIFRVRVKDPQESEILYWPDEDIVVTTRPVKASEIVFLANEGIYKNAFDFFRDANHFCNCQNRDYQRFEHFLKLICSPPLNFAKIKDLIAKYVWNNLTQVQSRVEDSMQNACYYSAWNWDQDLEKSKKMQAVLKNKRMSTQNGLLLGIEVKSVT